MEEVLAEIERNHVLDSIQEGKRVDERNFTDFREVEIETDFVGKAEGSARVKLGKTEVVVGVKFEPGEPFEDKPNDGVLITNAELNSMASPEFEPGPPGPEATEISRVVDRGIREADAIDLESLCIEEGEKVWMAFVDIHIIDHVGNLIDVSSIGAIAALMTAELPYEKYELDPNSTELNIQTIPVSITAQKIGGEIIYDPNHLEEEIGTTRVTVITNSNQNVVGMQKGISGDWKQDEILEVVDQSIKKGQQLREKIKENV
ncbi:RNA-binding protein [archaeon SCG-AAA382B04]|nr:RNA-binding protein [archaeon SCG-AAA382B04]